MFRATSVHEFYHAEIMAGGEENCRDELPTVICIQN